MNTNTKALLLNIKNSSSINKSEFYSMFSEKNLLIIRILYAQGFVQSYSVFKKSNNIHVVMRYFSNKPMFETLKFLSKSLKGLNLTFLDLSKIFNKRFVLFLSTNRGLSTSYTCLKNKTSGKALFIC